MFWFIGFVCVIAVRVFTAGMNTDAFYRKSRYSWENGPQFSGDAVFAYIMITMVVATTWFLSLPLLGVYKLGERYAKRGQ